MADGAGAERSLLQVTDGTEFAAQLEEELTVLWVLICAILVFFMQCGFALLESGAIRQKNTKNILLKNSIDACLSTLAWWAVGNAFASSGKCGKNGFIGHSNFFSSNANSDQGTYWAFWLFSWAFSATASTIVSGAVAERLQFRAYTIYTTFISAFLYPVVVHWVWSESGWLSARRKPCDATGFEPLFSKTNGVMDFAGSGVVHMLGGGAALMGTFIVGPRIGRFEADGKVNEFEPSSPTNMALGVFILWLGWYGFNAGSTNCFQNCMVLASKVAVNTTLSVGSSALACLMLAVVLGKAGDIGPLLNGVLAGAVAITAPCAFVQSYAAFIIGLVAAFVYTGCSMLMLKLRIDDPLDAVAVHFGCGAWGVLSVGFFATETSTTLVYGYANDWGVFYGGKGYQLGMQVLGVVMIAAWSISLSAVVFYALNKLCWMRVPREVENQGLDLVQSLASGVFGKVFGNKYTTVVQGYLARSSILPPKHMTDEEEGDDVIGSNGQHYS